MHVLHQPNDPVLYETLLYLAQNALESPTSNMRIQVDTVTLTCTAGVLKTATVTFKKPFKSAPFILLWGNPAIVSSAFTLSQDETKLTATGFQPQCYTSSNQDVKVTYLAIGQV